MIINLFKRRKARPTPAKLPLDRREFLKGLFGVAVVAALPPKLALMPEAEFVKKAREFAEFVPLSGGIEIWGNDKGDYSFTPLPGWRPLREESNNIGNEALNRFFKEYT